MDKGESHARLCFVLLFCSRENSSKHVFRCASQWWGCQCLQWHQDGTQAQICHLQDLRRCCQRCPRDHLQRHRLGCVHQGSPTQGLPLCGLRFPLPGWKRLLSICHPLSLLLMPFFPFVSPRMVVIAPRSSSLSGPLTPPRSRTRCWWPPPRTPLRRSLSVLERKSRPLMPQRSTWLPSLSKCWPLPDKRSRIK